jgi:hypothetical protein
MAGSFSALDSEGGAFGNFAFSVRDCFYLRLSMPIRQKYQVCLTRRPPLAALAIDL